MISTKAMIEDEFEKASGLEYEECDMDLDAVNDSGVDGTSGMKEECEPINESGGSENGNVAEAATSSGTNLFFNTSFFDGQRHRQTREAKALEISIANLKKKLQGQSRSKLLTAADGGLVTSAQSATNIEDKSFIRCDLGESTLEIDDCSGDSSDEAGQTAVERSLAAMSKSKTSVSKCSTSSRNSFNDTDDDGEGDEQEIKNDAFLDRIFASAGTDNSKSKNVEMSDLTGSTETSPSPSSGFISDKSAAARRKRQRRNPVWPYFVVKDGLATCRHCNYSTKSVFSTNLKVHLRTHHHDLFEEVIKAEEEQQEQVTLQNTLLAGCATTNSTTASTAANPYMHRVTTTALPALGSRGTTSNHNNINNNSSNCSINNVSSTTHQGARSLNSTAALLTILNQTGTFQNNPFSTSIVTSDRGISKLLLPELPKPFVESQLSLDYIKLAPDLAKALPDYLKVMSNDSKSVISVSSNTAKTLRSTNSRITETLRALNKTSPKAQCNINYVGDGRVEKSISRSNNQSPVVQKRRRLRRHPVWRFFKDVGDGSKTVKCVNCSFSTSSPFSTNLKMHLKAHHKSDYRLILILESRQRLEEGISPIPEPVQTPPLSSKRSRSEEHVDVDFADEQPEARKRSSRQVERGVVPSRDSVFEDENFASMTNTERVKAMIEMAAASQAQPVDCQDPTVDDTAFDETNAAAVAATDEVSGLVDTSLLVRLGLVKSDLLQLNPLQQKNQFQSPQSASGGSAIRTHLSGPLAAALDTTKSVRTVSKRLPTGEVVKVRQTRKCIENPVAQIITTAAPAAVATATINTTKPIVPSRDLTSSGFTDEQLTGMKLARDYALAKFLLKADAFQCLDLPEFKHFVDTLDPTYQIPHGNYLKHLLESSLSDHDLPSEQSLDSGVQEEEKYSP